MATNNNSFAKATNLGLLNGSKTRSGNLSASNPTDYFRFRLQQRSSFSSLLSGLQNDADLILFNNKRRRIAESSNPDTTDEAINAVLRSGTYYIQVKRQQGKTRYSLQLAAAGNTVDPGGTLNTASAISPGNASSIFINSVGGGDNNDYYVFSTRNPGNLSITLGGLTNPADVRVLDRNGTLIATSNQPGLALRTLNVNLAAGTYYLQVTAPNNAQTNYSLTTTLSASSLIGLSNNNSLLAFTPTNTNAANIPIQGLNVGETLLDIDFRPATGQLYGLSDQGRLYTLNLSNGLATQVGNTNVRVSLAGSQFAIDFDPTTDRLRVVSNVDQDLRVSPLSGTTLNTDPSLFYATTDINSSANPNITRIAYSNNSLSANRTTLYGIDTTLNNLVTQGSPAGIPTSSNTGQLFTIGSTGSNAGTSLVGNGGFDIFTDATGTDFAYATSGAGLFTVNLSTGATTLVTTINVGGVLISTLGIAALPIDFF